MITLDDGTVLPIGISSAPLPRSTTAGSCGAVAIFQDLSEIKQLQRQVLQSEKMASIGQLAAGVAHEINNPMGFIHANLFQMTEYLEQICVRVYWDARGSSSSQPLAAGRSRGASRNGLRGADVRLAEQIDVDFVRADFVKGRARIAGGLGADPAHRARPARLLAPGTAERVLADVNQCVDSTANIVWTR